jgi:excisionase family DNA binding protein
MEQVTILTTETDIKKIVIDIVNELKNNEQPTVEAEKPEERLLTSAETCKFLRCSKPTLHRWKMAGIVPFVRLGGNIRYRESDLQQLIERKGK